MHIYYMPVAWYVNAEHTCTARDYNESHGMWFDFQFKTIRDNN